MDKLLGGDAQLLFAGVVEAYPYDRPHPQEWHRDGQALSSDPTVQLAPHCLNLFVPLVDITDEVGPTEFWLGTHIEAAYKKLQVEQQISTTPKPGPNGSTIRVLAPAGSAILFDYRTIHRGAANSSGTPRRVLYLTYARKWFTDAKNFNAPSILETTTVPPSVRTSLDSAMSSFFHAVRLQNLDQRSSQLAAQWCEVGHPRYTANFGALLARIYVANQRHAFKPYSDHADGGADGDEVGKDAAAAAVAALNAAGNGSMAWVSILQGRANDRMHDVNFLRNVAASFRLMHSISTESGPDREMLSRHLSDVVENLTSSAAHEARLCAVAAALAARRTPPRGQFEAATSFRGGYSGYVFRLGEQGLGYYVDCGGAEMSAEVIALAAEVVQTTASVTAEPAVARGVDRLKTAVGTVRLGDHAWIHWDDGQEYEATAVQLDGSALTVRWRYIPTPGWDEWEESVPVDTFAARGIRLQADSSDAKADDEQASIEPSISEVDGQIELSRTVSQKSEAGFSTGTAPDVTPEKEEEARRIDKHLVTQPVLESAETADFGETGADLQASNRLEDLVLRACAGALDHYGFTTNRIGWQLFFATAKATALAMGAYSTASALEESLSGWFHGGRGRFELVGFAHGLCLPALCCLCAERPGNVLR